MVIMLIGASMVTFFVLPGLGILQSLFVLGAVWHSCFVGYCVLAWRMETLELREGMCVLRSGVIVKVGKTIGYDSISDYQVVQSLFGRLFGYGTVVLVLESREGTKQVRLPYIPEVRQVTEALECGR
jgi:uncharacterized membrane protein YdbT with pleckstrin-like domain